MDMRAEGAKKVVVPPGFLNRGEQPIKDRWYYKLKAEMERALNGDSLSLRHPWSQEEEDMLVLAARSPEFRGPNGPRWGVIAAKCSTFDGLTGAALRFRHASLMKS